MGVTENIRWKSVKKFTESSIKEGNVIHSDGYQSYISALKEHYDHHHKVYDPNAAELK